ncbi:flagellar biosynthesis anti-sigma factor FlgM [Thalassotalea profundi]|uniref:Negative regulator of flagellin synthesis n=1 Tax=Thalassotalea profundi TaxID=2036687 RepID=A0ABQ3IJX9_9GAMM|nr:flagellar biosynthesis anti-sigma factor FlgM [Thalassotalea profundi]GHE81129.1 flagellar biosynthesis anti-sigma factor FlgM [Thalassotalea profundi]
MAININNLSSGSQVKQSVDLQSQVKEKAAQTTASAEQAKFASKDSVSITPQAKQFTELQKKAQAAPAVDAKKVAQLKKAIESGEYKVNPEKLAASIAKFEFDLV